MEKYAIVAVIIIMSTVIYHINRFRKLKKMTEDRESEKHEEEAKSFLREICGPMVQVAPAEKPSFYRRLYVYGSVLMIYNKAKMDNGWMECLSTQIGVNMRTREFCFLDHRGNVKHQFFPIHTLSQRLSEILGSQPAYMTTETIEVF